jgi:hypothetical protein
MRDRYIRLIADLDGVLSLVRLMWLQASNLEDRQHYRVKIDGLLDQRIELMKERDAV